jgi:hypothetical protein
VGKLFGVILTLPVSLTVWLSRRGTETPHEAIAAAIQEPVAWVSRGSIKMVVRDRIAHVCYDIFSGLGSVLAAALLFHVFQLPLRLWVLLIMVVWEIIVSCGQSFRVLFGSLAGMLVGWFVVLRLFSF